MDKKFYITDGELEIMRIIWKKDGPTFKELMEELEKVKKRNKNTVKTLLYRLVKKEAIWIAAMEEYDEKIRYWSAYSEEEYLKKENEKFLNRLYKGSANNLLLNFAKEKKINKEEVQKLLDILED